MIEIWNTIFYEPLYNALVFLVNVIPGGNVGIAVILLTLVVKFILSPLSYRAITSQIAQQKLQPLIQKIKKDFPDQKEQTQKIMELYKEHKTNPFSGCLLLLLQFPVIIGLYQVFLKGIDSTEGVLYSFMNQPDTFSTVFLWTNLNEKSLIFAIVAGLTQFIQIKYSPAMNTQNSTENTASDPAMQMAQNMSKSMKFTMPIMITIFAYFVPAAVALYWIITNVYTVLQEISITKRLKKKQEAYES